MATISRRSTADGMIHFSLFFTTVPFSRMAALPVSWPAKQRRKGLSPLPTRLPDGSAIKPIRSTTSSFRVYLAISRRGDRPSPKEIVSLDWCGFLRCRCGFGVPVDDSGGRNLERRLGRIKRRLSCRRGGRRGLRNGWPLCVGRWWHLARVRAYLVDQRWIVARSGRSCRVCFCDLPLARTDLARQHLVAAKPGT